ncbi:MAG: uracil phosphoribosyltransferase [Methanocellales archaeon]|nr:uracil phosphoribosyltransferase [Methanocellales archaeon]MDD3291093.1 uracil phosphoribosyltransferase [Methanocellales archaeon]MDD5234978.1 uracil phosphoribosyltransferase [Methanocellales archaeon]MDD5484651.1 uracil phosphoribosyltransferase [Methanocellales archaeon]
MFAHRKLLNPVADEEYTNIQKTISKDVAYKAAEVLGEYTATDMLDFATLSKPDISRIYVKYRDGLPMASGMKKMLPNADVIYVTSERTGNNNNNVEISLLDTESIEGTNFDESSIMWLADPINARGNTAIKTMRYLRNYFPFDLVLFSHIVANTIGVKTVQTQVTDFNIDGYMNYTFLSKKINQATGFLKDALEVIPDFGDKVFGTVGADYPVYQMQKDIRRLLKTKAGDIEVLKGVIIYLLQRRENEDYKVDRRVVWATRLWIKEAIIWYKKLRDLQINIDIEQHFDFIIDDLVNRGFLGYKKYPYKDTYAYHYYVTEEGVNISSASYLPILDELKILRIINKDFDYLVHIPANEIRKQVHKYGS